MERFPKMESLFSCLAFALIAMASSMQLAHADAIGPPRSETLIGGYRSDQLLAQQQQSGWPSNPPQWQQNSAPSSPMPQNYQQPAYPSQDQAAGQQNFGQQQPAFGNTSQPIQPNQLQGYPVSQQAPGQLPPQNNMQYGQAQASGSASQPGWTADYPNPNDANNMASQVPMDTAHKKGGGVGSMIGKALGGVAKMAPTVAGAGMAGMTNMAVGNMMMNGGGYGMPYGMGGGYGMPYGMGGYGQNMMMNGVLNQGLRMLQSR